MKHQGRQVIKASRSITAQTPRKAIRSALFCLSLALISYEGQLTTFALTPSASFSSLIRSSKCKHQKYPHTFSSTALLGKKKKSANSDEVTLDGDDSLSNTVDSFTYETDPFNSAHVQQNTRKAMTLARQEVVKRRQARQASADMDLPEQPPVQTVAGGPSLIFQAARRLWDSNNSDDDVEGGLFEKVPRWHPTTGISDINPQFRTQSPVMDQQGYAGTIWRNVRKRSKPSMWRYALRTFDRMVDQPQGATRVERSIVHYEGALLACAKLGLWERAIEIFEEVEERESTLRERLRANPKKRNLSLRVTESMIMSLTKACVRGARSISKDRSVSERRKPVDAIATLLMTLEKKHNLPLVALHLNPVASAYQSMGLFQDAANLLQSNLGDRTIGPESENGTDPFNVNDVRAKDKSSYALLVHGAVSDGEWAGAVDALKDMTEAGLYPNARHLNSWAEVSERKNKPRTTRSWKKKRDENWLETVR